MTVDAKGIDPEVVAVITAAIDQMMGGAAKGIDPEIAAVITAAIYQMMGSTSFQAVKITRDSDSWISAGRRNA